MRSFIIKAARVEYLLSFCNVKENHAHVFGDQSSLCHGTVTVREGFVFQGFCHDGPSLLVIPLSVCESALSLAPPKRLP
jgi:hypothetical protein